LSASLPLLGDTLHNVADALTAVPLLIAFWLARNPPNDRYTYGYGGPRTWPGSSSWR
jgi:divalent metal cation (Fe/Co/Zn/Cd) transporter